jgi:transglutaminase-like putative cysteine protease
MKIQGLVFTCFLLLMPFGCRETPDNCNKLLKQIGTEFSAGNLTMVKILSDSVKKICPDSKSLVHKSDSISQIAERIELDFPFTENIIDQQLKERNGIFTADEKTEWEKNNWLEWKMINGEKRYFSRATSNLDLIRSFYLERSRKDSVEAADTEITYRKKYTQLIIKASENGPNPVLPVNLTMYYTITVSADAVPAGEIIRCWLPYPEENHPRQHNVRLLSTSEENFVLAPDSAIHRTVYMETKAEKGLPVIFNVSFSYQSSGQYFDPDKMNITPYDKNSTLYKEYTSEQLPHICFTEKIKYLADSLTGSEVRPFEIVRKIYTWFTNNIPWAGAQEYSIISNIPEYVLQNRRGDCGMQTFLFMSMLRHKGIPVRWQSGWKVPPDAKNLHDWCEVYFEGTGWVPVDISYGLQYSDNQKTREFYISGIDSYRLIINEGVAGRLFPEKKFLRSEPFDFQRGEVEWSGGNLYFDKWHYNMEIIYNK